MLYVDDAYFHKGYFASLFALFDQHPILSDCRNHAIAVRLVDPAFWIALCLYCKERGGTVFPLSVDTPLEAARRRAQRSGCTYLIFGVEGAEALKNMESVPQSEESEARDRAPALIQMSSGTTGEAKTIERSWLSIETEVQSYIEHFQSAQDMTPIVACPINHSYGLISGVLVALKRGVSPIVVKNLNPKFVLRKLNEVASPLLYSSPSLIDALTMLVREGRPLHAVMTSGSVMHKTRFESLSGKVRHLHQQYGCSEVGCVSLAEDISTANDVGRSLPHLGLSAGKDADHPAEVLIHPPGNASIATRDLGYLQGGHLYFTSRLDDVINVAGLNVYPQEVEEVVLEIPSVIDAVVFAGRHGSPGEQVSLHFVSTIELSKQEIRKWCGERLAGYQIPLNITQVAFIPKLPNGKVRRRDLSDQNAEASFGQILPGLSP